MSPSPLPSSRSGSITAQPSFAPPSAQAVEVVTMLGDSVVGVAHLEPAERAPSRTHGKLALALGALLLLVAGLAFARGLTAAAADQRALVHWRDVLGRPAYDFRPTRLHPIYDWMAALGLAGGLGALTWGTVRLRARALRDRFTIGSEPGVDAGVTGPAGQYPPCHALVRWDASGALVSVTGGMRARLHRDGRAYELDELAALGLTRTAPPNAGAGACPGVRELAMPASGSVRVDMSAGPIAFVVRMVAAGRTRGLSGHALPERRTLAFVLGSFAAHLVLLALVSAIPPDARSMAFGIQNAGGLRVRAAWKPPEDPRRLTSEDAPPGGHASASMKLPGDVPAVDVPSTGGGAHTDALAPRPPGSRDEARHMARTQGMLAFLGSNPGVFDPLAEIGTFQAEPGAITDYGTAVGLGPGSTWGPFGTGPGGFALQPGGTVVSGRYDTIGVPGGPGPGHIGFPPFGGNPRRPGFTGPTVQMGEVKVPGGLDPEIIRRAIHRQRERIRHCYERTLLTAPDLTGTVVTEFLISPEGKVLRSSASGLGHDGVQSCIAGVIQSISFPRTSAAELTRVTYPFELRNTGR
jgi:hypothetical protein